MSCEYVGELRSIDHDGDSAVSAYACWDCPGRPLVLDPAAHQRAHHPEPTSPDPRKD